MALPRTLRIGNERVSVFEWTDLSLFPGPEAKIRDMSSIGQSLLILSNVIRREFLFNPEFGSDTEDQLFEPIDDETSNDIRVRLILSLERWDPRVGISGRSAVIPN